jgi:hypothetical protein
VTRDVRFDAFHYKKLTDVTGNGDSEAPGHYCEVASEIRAATPTITTPSQGATDVALDFTAEFSAYADHRTDAQSCFDSNATHIQIDEDGGDWSSLVFEYNGTPVSSKQVTGLSDNDVYQIRVRHQSTNSDRSTDHWGAWSTVHDFTTVASEQTISGVVISSLPLTVLVR